MFEITTYSPEETQQLGSYLGELAQPGDVYLLVGSLGTGKTSLTQGIAWGLGVKEYAFSPSFVILREYHGRLPLYHIDFYRLENLKEIADLGLEDYLYGRGLCVVEWAEKGLDLMPEENLLIKLSYVADTQRHFTFQPRGKRYQKIIKTLSQKLKEKP